MSDEVVPNVIAETAEVLADAVINVVDAAAQAAPEAIKETVPEVIREATAAAPEVIRETVPEVIKAAIEPDVVDEATRVYNYVVTCMAYASLALAVCIVVAWRLFGARVAALVAPPARPPPRRGGGSWRAWATCRRRTRRRGTRPPRKSGEPYWMRGPSTRISRLWINACNPRGERAYLRPFFLPSRLPMIERRQL